VTLGEVHVHEERSAMIRLGILGLLLLSAPVRAAPPADADPALSPWFQSLRQPGTGVSCCSVADCRPVDYRTTASGYEVWIENRWQPVPPEKVLQRADNPVGRAIVCWTKQIGIMCFVRAPET
jgi:hypothetical protein